MNNLKLWSKEFIKWLAEANVATMCILIILATFLLGFSTWTSEVSIRSSGYALQLVGMLFAIRGLLGVRRHFKQTPFLSLTSDWLKRFPKWKRDVEITFGTAIAKSTAGSLQTQNWSPDDIEAPIEERINKLVHNVESLRGIQLSHFSSINQLQLDHEAHKNEVKENAKELKSNIHKEQEAFHTNDLITSLVGLIWLTIGITMSTLAPEILKCLS